MEEQGAGVGGKQRGRLLANRDQGISHQQAAAGAMQASRFHEGAKAQIQRTQGDPVQFVGVGETLIKQKPGALGRKAQPAQGQLEGKAPLPRGHPNLGRRKGPRQGWQGQLVLQARTGGQHDREHRSIAGFQLSQGRAHLTGGRQRGIKQ